MDGPAAAAPLASDAGAASPPPPYKKQRQIRVAYDTKENVLRRRFQGALDEDQIADHLEKYLQAEDNRDKCTVFQDTFRSVGVHIYVFPPSKMLGRDFYTLVTMGMSGTRMNVPSDIDDAEEYRHAELMCFLPSTWKVPKMLTGRQLFGGKDTDGLAGIEAEDHRRDEASWPFEMLRKLAGYVIDTKAWVSWDHGLPNLFDPNGDGKWHCCMKDDKTDVMPYVNGSKLSHVVLLEPVFEKEGFAPLTIKIEAPNSDSREREKIIADQSMLKAELTIPVAEKSEQLNSDNSDKQDSNNIDKSNVQEGKEIEKSSGGEKIENISANVKPSIPSSVPDLEFPKLTQGSTKFTTKKVNFLLVVPVTSAEAQWKREVGIQNSLYYAVGDQRVNPTVPISYVINQNRPCCVQDLNLPGRLAERG
mmetsp:Transcript_26306/g.63393  ORF Transcript_26306/g.63393 Transcript_26306/m.63393 type:complete len:418 (-) Transcript_26306:150-1403(-)